MKSSIIRFKGYTNDFKQCFLKDVVSILGGYAWKSDDYQDDGNYLIITITNVTGDTTIDDTVGNRINCESNNPFILNKNDILISLTGNVGRVSKMTNIPAVLNQRVAKIMAKNNYVVNDFIFHLLKSSRFEKAMIDAGQGAAQKNISNEDIMSYQFQIPKDIKEQISISSLFNHLDTLIDIQEKKINKLKQAKLALLQVMFPQGGESTPKARFDGYTQPWELCKFGELYKVNNEHNKKLIGYNKTFSIATMTYKDEGNGAADTSLANYKVLKIGDIAFEGHTNKEFRYGRFVANDVGDGIMSPRFSTLRPINKMPISFWKYYIHYEPIMRNKLVHSTKAGTMMNELVTSDFFEQDIFVPQIEEQERIGCYLKSIDYLIVLYQHKLEKYKDIKLALLNKMFYIDE